jgi:DNA-binding MarR family transcriptional regulator/GNAT superfamily N-acetyltransferase
VPAKKKRPRPTSPSPLDSRVDSVRRFNRFYTNLIGVLDEGHLESTFSLAQVRVLYELANRTDPTATEIGRDLNLDAGYLSRLLRTLEQKDLIERSDSRADGRQSHLRLTSKGRNTFADLDERARAAISTLLQRYSDLEQRRVINAMHAVETVMGAGAKSAAPVIFRDPQPGDLGLIVSRQAILYAREYGWNQEYEALISHIVGDFVQNFDRKRERCWVAEQDGEVVGSVFLLRHPERKGVAKLRLLYVEPATRGLGIGRRLVSECTSFARQAGYRTITLWTNSVLTSARRIYEAEGYRLVHEEPHRSFGHDLVSQTWELPTVWTAR